MAGRATQIGCVSDFNTTREGGREEESSRHIEEVAPPGLYVDGAQAVVYSFGPVSLFFVDGRMLDWIETKQ